MKKKWGEPIVQVQLFVPQDCVAACSQINDRYIDYGGGGTPKNNGIRNDGEEQDSLWGSTYLIGATEGPHYNVNAYSNGERSLLRYGDLDFHYTGTPKFYPVVDIRYEGTLLFRYYKAYNATS